MCFLSSCLHSAMSLKWYRMVLYNSAMSLKWHRMVLYNSSYYYYKKTPCVPSHLRKAKPLMEYKLDQHTQIANPSKP